MEPNSSQKRAHDDAFSQLALPPNPSKSSALEPDQQQPEITPLDCLPKPLATKQYIERSLESSANSRQTFRLASFVPPAAQSHQRRRLDSTVYHSTIPFDAQWEDKLEQIKVD
ncbi:hypothetical protein CLU79DRAFT_722053 [Phycomyces nitens]|nr:hypothetical protein CLU79DRAFT_722053 [Phycomyces nitens]